MKNHLWNTATRKRALLFAVMAFAVVGPCAACAGARNPPNLSASAKTQCAPAKGQCVPANSCSATQSLTEGIAEFDCSSAYDHKQGEHLRLWKSGGPLGAAWNWYGADLRCSVTLKNFCSGDARIRLYLGGIAVADGKVAVSTSRLTNWQASVTSEVWEKTLEPHESGMFQTGLFVARVDLTCPQQIGGEPELVFWSDSFLGGFSGGE